MTRTTKTAATPRILIFSAAKLPGGKNSQPRVRASQATRASGIPAGRPEARTSATLSNVKPIDPDDRRIFDGRVDMIELYRAGLKPPSRIERISDWLGRTYRADPRGLAWFAATLFPICIAAFCVGYFGGRELLALVLR